MPWAAQLPYKELGPLNEKIGGFAEVVVFDQPTLSLLVTDLVVAISEEPPPILAENDVRALLYHSNPNPPLPLVCLLWPCFPSLYSLWLYLLGARATLPLTRRADRAGA